MVGSVVGLLDIDGGDGGMLVGELKGEFVVPGPGFGCLLAVLKSDLAASRDLRTAHVDDETAGDEFARRGTDALQHQAADLGLDRGDRGGLAIAKLDGHPVVALFGNADREVERRMGGVSGLFETIADVVGIGRGFGGGEVEVKSGGLRGGEAGEGKDATAASLVSCYARAGTGSRGIRRRVRRFIV